MAWVLTVLALVHPLAGVAARWDWRADLLTHFEALALAITLTALGGALAVDRRRLAAGLAVLAVCQVWPLVRYQWPNPVPPDLGSPARLRVVVANVRYDNPHHDRLARLIRDERPDVVALVEVSTEWLDGLADVRRAYPHQVEAPGGGQGLALWFRAPPRFVSKPARATPDGWPYLHAVIDFAGRPRDLWLLHPASPLQPERRRPGFPDLAALAPRIGRAGRSAIVVGDLNTTAASPHFRDFLRRTGLRDSRLGFGAAASWPSWSPYRIAIDHALLPADLAAADRRLGPHIGSDHYPFILDVAPAAPRSSTTRATHPGQSSW